MPIVKKLRVGNKLIEGGRVYKVFKITFLENEGRKERIIHYKPHYQDSNYGSLVCSIPECNLVDTDKRMPVSKREILDILKYLSKRSNRKNEVDAVDAKSVLSLNDFHETAKVLKGFWREKIKKDVNFTKTKSDVLQRAIDNMVEEVALVFGISTDNAKQKINLALKNYPN